MVLQTAAKKVQSWGSNSYIMATGQGLLTTHGTASCRLRITEETAAKGQTHKQLFKVMK